jgi:hypothetical protein
MPEDSLALASAGANNQYIVGPNQTLRIVVSTAAVYMKFGDAGMAVADATNVLLPIGVHFANSDALSFMSISTPANANVVKIR